MNANDFEGSIAQENVNFSTEITVSTSPGSNFYAALVFVPFVELADQLQSTDGVTAGTVLTVKGSNYSTVAKGNLLKKLTAFYTEQISRIVYVVIYNTATGTTLTDLYTKYRSYGYWLGISSTTVADWVTLATLQKTNKKYSSPILLDTETYSILDTASIYYALKNGKLDFWGFYATDATTSCPSYYHLGRSLSFTNLSGTPVGNSLDYVSCKNIAAAGVNGENLDSTVKTQLEGNNINYFNTIGDGTGAVAAIGGKSSNGNYMAADWIVAYCNFVNQIKTAEIITEMNTFRNSATYAKIIQSMKEVCSRFTDVGGMGRLTGFKVTAPKFEALVKLKGDNITIPNAWAAEYADNVRSVDVQGNLALSA